MRVLLAHNRYRSTAPSGEDVVFSNERALLEANGVEVVAYVLRNDDLDDSTLGGRLRIAANTVWCRHTYRELCDLIARQKPDIAHFHNTFPQISASGYAACRAAGIPVVQTLHNYRLLCAGALLQRAGRPCEACLRTPLWPGLLHRCYRGSLAATVAVTAMLALSRANGFHRRGVDRYIALTEFAAAKLISGGLPAEKVVVKPNFLPNPPPVGSGRGRYVIYVGRLSAEKGLMTLVEAWRALPHPPLKIAGDGPLYKALAGVVQREGLSIEMLGYRSREEVLGLVSRADLQVVPSECYEGFPMVVLEAFSCGTPVVASRIGSLAEIVVDGVTGTTFAPADAADLRRTVTELVRNPTKLEALRRGARATFDEKYTAERNLEQLLAIYSGVLQ